MDKVLALLGVNSLSESKKNEIKSILTTLIQNRLDVDPQNYDSNMTKLVESIGGHKLKAEIQKDLMEKLNLIIDIQSQKISDEKLINEDGNIDKNWFKWDSSTVVKKTVDKISKDLFQWEQAGYGGRSYETKSKDKSTGTKIFFERNTKKILYSDHPEFKHNQKMTESDINAAIDDGYSIVPWSTDSADWKREMMEKVNQRRV